MVFPLCPTGKAQMSKIKKSHVNNRMKAIWYSGDFKSHYIPHILKELYIECVYEPYFMGRKDLTILDLGAHIGLFTLYAHEYAKEIYCVEPSSENFDALALNTAELKNVTRYKSAISNKNGTMALYHSQNKTANTLVAGDESHSEVVETWTIEKLVKFTGEKKIDFMKLDIEGSEFEVLSGEPFRKVAPMIDTIYGEMHSWAGRNYNQIKWALKDNGYEVTFHHHDASIFSARRVK